MKTANRARRAPPLWLSGAWMEIDQWLRLIEPEISAEIARLEQDGNPTMLGERPH